MRRTRGARAPCQPEAAAPTAGKAWAGHVLVGWRPKICRAAANNLPAGGQKRDQIGSILHNMSKTPQVSATGGVARGLAARGNFLLQRQKFVNVLPTFCFLVAQNRFKKIQKPTTLCSRSNSVVVRCTKSRAYKKTYFFRATQAKKATRKPQITWSKRQNNWIRPKKTETQNRREPAGAARAAKELFAKAPGRRGQPSQKALSPESFKHGVPALYTGRRIVLVTWGRATNPGPTPVQKPPARGALSMRKIIFLCLRRSSFLRRLARGAESPLQKAASPQLFAPARSRFFCVHFLFAIFQVIDLGWQNDSLHDVRMALGKGVIY